MYSVIIPEKFTSKNLMSVIKENWEKSLLSDEVEFDLSLAQWIALEELTFLFSWIIRLRKKNKINVRVKLPFTYKISGEVKGKYRWPYERRIDLHFNLLVKWNLAEICELTEDMLIGIDHNVLMEKQAKPNIDQLLNKIIPVKALLLKQDSDYDLLDIPAEIRDLFELEVEVRELLNRETSINPIDNKILSHIITIELFLNSSYHAFNEDKIENEHCFIAMGLVSKIKRLEKEELFETLISRYGERASEERNYFLDNWKGKEPVYKNDAYIEYSFVDFGEGIVKTLRESYLKDLKQDTEKIDSMLTLKESKKSIDMRILEYAFLLHSSKNPFEESLRISGFVPRGLFFIKELVKRHQGMLIVRSNKAKIVFDFSETASKDVVGINMDSDFPGTMISIVLPTKEKVSMSAIVNNTSRIQKPTNNKIVKRKVEYIEINKILNYMTNSEEFSSKNLTERYTTIFKFLNDKLTESNYDKSLLYFDFCGLDYLYEPIVMKIFYYLANTPLINEEANIIIVNTTNKKLIEKVRDDIIACDYFICRPIPCYNIDGTISWIGIKYLENEQQLNELLFDPNVTKSASDLIEPNLLSGNIIVVQWIDQKANSGNVFLDVSVQNYHEVQNNISHLIEIYLDNEFKKKEICLVEDHRAYLTASGLYQKEFMMLIEKFYDEDYTRMLAGYMLRKFYLEKRILQVADIVLSVTLSGQLLAQQILNLYNVLNSFEDYKSPSFLTLSSYTDFDSELPFNDITENKNIFIVLDVLSTGNLRHRLFKYINNKNAKVLAVCCLLDVREKDISTQTDLDEITFVLYNKKEIKKFEDNPYEGSLPIFVNPILNAPTTMPRSNAVVYANVLDADEFLKECSKKDHLWIGHFKHNTVHHNYFIKTSRLFKSDKGEIILKKIFEGLKSKETEKKSNLILNIISRIEQDIFLLKGQVDDINSKGLKNAVKEFSKIKQNFEKLPFKADEFEIDYVFYPMFSGIEAIVNRLRDYVKIKESIFPIPRIMTKKGWRFTFPSKFLNDLTKDKTVLLIDDGSSTGETLKQMIDSIAYMDISKLYYLSIVARLEDFDREFFSRINYIKTKHHEKGNLIPIQIFFGIHLHIPVYSATKTNCYLCQETSYLKSIKNKNFPDIFNEIEEYINDRLKEINLYDTNTKDYNGIPDYFPNDIDVTSIYKARDIIGRFDSYRIFMEDNQELINNLINEIGIEPIVALIIHEPVLVNSIKSFYPELISKNIRTFIDKVISNRENTKYKWKKYSILRLVNIINPDFLYSYEYLSYLIRAIDNDKESLNYLAFICYDIFKFNKISDNEKLIIKKNIELLWKEYKTGSSHRTETTNIVRMILNFINKQEISLGKYGFIIENFYKLKKVYINEETQVHLQKEIEVSLIKMVQQIQQKEMRDILLSNWRDGEKSLETRLNYFVGHVEKLEPMLNRYKPDLYCDIIVNDKSLKKSIEIINRNLLSYNPENSNLEIQDLLNKIRSDFTNPNSRILRFFNDFGCDPREQWKSSLSKIKDKFSSKNLKIEYLNNLSEKYIYALIHREFLEIIFDEILEDIYKFSPLNASLSYDWKLDDEFLTLNIYQSWIFKEEGAGSGLNTIKEIIDYFNGLFIKPDEQNKNFVLKFRIIKDEKP